MNYYAKTDKGAVRRNNEDACYVPADTSRGFFAVVADGMGGHNAGEVASSIVVETFKSMLEGMKPEDVTENLLRQIFREANARVLTDAKANSERSGMGSTATAAIFCGHDVMIGHVGDSRAYLYHAGSLRQITRDHSYVQMLMDLGYINEEQAAKHPQKNVITRAVGTDAEVDTDIFHVTMCKGDCLLLCSDGLNGMINDENIASILGDGYQEAAERLIKAALEAGGGDNVSVVLACMDGDIA